VPGAADARGRINFLELGKGSTSRPGGCSGCITSRRQWRGRHGHRETELLLIAMHGGCQPISTTGTASRR
jgi:hypothetical protein